MLKYVIWDMGETLNTVPHTRYDFEPLTEYPEVVLRDGALAVLEQVRELGFRQAILSNTAVSDSEVVRKLLSRWGILDYFDFVHASNSELEEGRPEKPDRAIFELVLDALGIVAEQAVMIGNTWESDIIGANRVGMDSIWLVNPEVSIRKPESHADTVVAPPFICPVWDLEDVPQALKVLQKVKNTETDRFFS
ncbi:HAD family hydrolase [Listeria costaricensis]|uniref:HAD family hydrolase n=1 Tax=Listeria costaricensis TaxID=2026604 RepID=UPI000C06A51A|nr:HAD family hydrolase [Listeria costaricensis]